MNLDQLLADLRRSEITLSLEGDRLHYHTRPGLLTPELRTAIVERRTELIEWLKGGQHPLGKPGRCVTCKPEYWVDDPPDGDRIRTTCRKCGRFMGYREVGL